jgi:phage/plasmid-like protein (TIGR03299 family)
MSHELEIVNGMANMAYRESKGLPWHGLGTPVHDNMTPMEMMKAANLDWKVSKKKSYVEINGQKVETGQEALVRESDGRILTNVSGAWKPCQNEQAFEFFNEFVSAGDMQMDTAGSLKDGQIVFAAADVNDGFTLFGGDEVKGYLLFSNPHVYGKSIDVKFIMTRVVCNNTLSMALTERGQPAVRLSHRNNFNPEMVKELLGISHNRVEQFKGAAELLGSKKYSDKAFKTFLATVFGTSNQEGKILSRTAERAFEIVETQPGADYAPKSWWNAYNAVTYMTDHEMGRSDDTRAAAAWFGHNAKRKLEALNVAVEMAEVA